MFFLTQDRLKHLRSRNYLPRTCLDLGSNIGDWNLMFKSIFPECDVYSIEANPLCAIKLKERNLNHEITLIGSENKKSVHFYVEKNDCLSGGASIYLENTSYYNTYFTIDLPMKTLDSLNRNFDFIKIDVQGAELDVLKGGLNTISKADFVLLELAAVNYNHGAPLCNEVIEYLKRLGFIIYDIFELHYDTFFKCNRQLLQIDFCFINRKLKSKFIDVW